LNTPALDFTGKRDLEQQHTRSLERELEIGRRIQAGFLPESLPRPPGWELAAAFQPARMVSGDFYDAFSLPGDLLCLVIADVCDKGVGAALFMALFRTLVRANAGALFGAGGAQPKVALLDTIRRTNDYIAGTHGSANMFATMFLAVLDTESNDLHYVNAGNEPPILRGANGAIRRLEPTGPAVGMLPGLEFATAQVRLEFGDLLLCFTDGVTEARDPAGGLFGDERLLAALTLGARASVAVGALQAALSAFTAGAEPADDITILAASCP
jgi:serine phosphatase RsbU (regulator of sigma subunit)